MLKMTVAVVVHLVLLALACTRFTLLTGWVNGAWTCDFCTYRYGDGWGYVYRSDYTLPVILVYLAAYAAGLAVYQFAWSAGSRYLASTGLALCVVGLLSFGIEGSHWCLCHTTSRGLHRFLCHVPSRHRCWLSILPPDRPPVSCRIESRAWLKIRPLTSGRNPFTRHLIEPYFNPASLFATPCTALATACNSAAVS